MYAIYQEAQQIPFRVTEDTLDLQYFVVAYSYYLAYVYQTPSFNFGTVVHREKLPFINSRSLSQTSGGINSWANAVVEDHQQVCAKDGTG